MGESTIIAWTERTFNPWIGCLKISPGCDNCYAEVLARTRLNLDVWDKGGARHVTKPSTWANPRAWNREGERRTSAPWPAPPGPGGRGRPVLTFCASLCDVFEDHPVADATRPKLWQLVRETPYLYWQILTKRAGRIAAKLPADWGDGYPNVWLGTSIESNDFAWRADHLRKIPAAVRFVSYEPALGPLDRLSLDGLDWIIFGGESGNGYRGMDPQWARDMRDRCERAGVAFFFKQSAAPRTEMGTTLDGRTVRKYPTPRKTTGGPRPAGLFR